MKILLMAKVRVTSFGENTFIVYSSAVNFSMAKERATSLLMKPTLSACSLRFFFRW
jgi:hypothetical protein